MVGHCGEPNPTTGITDFDYSSFRCFARHLFFSRTERQSQLLYFQQESFLNYLQQTIT